ncbi:hypothetical protein J9253_02285 [Thiothrix litoralis]|uniref:Uncharacterized protein n=1 Tax=Thiothrix litoralis TaxID=2891210 RepID=A0ABX7X0X4_9GAMM|nr:hypothetical protein [Thiothrix litoralis]QTR46800.1 hypothetical protein J9253_02285 [Thiothrix litoralis]
MYHHRHQTHHISRQLAGGLLPIEMLAACFRTRCSKPENFCRVEVSGKLQHLIGNGLDMIQIGRFRFFRRTTNHCK